MNREAYRAERLREWLQTVFGWTPADLTLCQTALTHRSATGPNNERLEFLGDAVLSVVVAQHLYERFRDADEGALSRLRARVVSGVALAEVSGAIGLGEWLQLGPGELKTGGYRRDSILADAFEALCGAMYLSGGLEMARAAMLRVLDPSLSALGTAEELKDPKTRLQELLQARGLPLPQYQVEAVEGEPHAQVFSVTCVVEVLQARASASGSSRRRAEQAAAARVLEQVKV